MPFVSFVTIWYTFWVETDSLPPISAFFSAQALHEPRYLIQLLVLTYRWQAGMGDSPLSFARFAKALSQSAPQLNLHLSPQTIKNWEGGLHCPNFFFILRLADQAPEGSWPRAFAMDVLAVQWPTLYPPGSEIGASYVKALLGDERLASLSSRMLTMPAFWVSVS